MGNITFNGKILRFGKTLSISDNYGLKIHFDPKVIVIPAGATTAEFSVRVMKDGKELFPDFDESLSANLLTNSNANDRTNISSNNGTSYPISKASMTEGARNFIRIKRASPELSPTAMSLYNALALSYLTKDVIGKKITVSFEARSSHDTTMTFNGIEYNPEVNLPIKGSRTDLATEWRRYHVTFVKNEAQLDGVRISPYIVTIVGDPNEFYIDVCRYKVVLGDIKDEWTPAPEEILQNAVINTMNCSAAIADDKVKLTSIDTSKDEIWVDITVKYGELTSKRRMAIKAVV